MMHDIVAVDDSPEIREVLSRALLRYGWDVVTFHCPAKALPELDSAGTRLLLTDINMPEMDGISFARQVRRKHPDLPIIALTASMDVSALDAKDFNEALSKPFRMAELLAALSRHLGPPPAPPTGTPRSAV